MAEMNRMQQPRAIALTQVRSRAWFPQGYDGETHYSEVLRALAPAAAILAAASILMLVLL
jgi:hypothetical protein